MKKKKKKRKLIEIFERFSLIFLLKSSKDLSMKMHKDFQNNEITRQSYVKIFVRSQKRFGFWKKNLILWLNLMAF